MLPAGSIARGTNLFRFSSSAFVSANRSSSTTSTSAMRRISRQVRQDSSGCVVRNRRISSSSVRPNTREAKVMETQQPPNKVQLGPTGAYVASPREAMVYLGLAREKLYELINTNQTK